MTDVIDTMTRDELVAKCTNQRIEIGHLLNAANAYVSMSVDRGVVIRAAIKHLKYNRTTSAMATLRGYVRRAESIECLRELAGNTDEHTRSTEG